MATSLGISVYEYLRRTGIDPVDAFIALEYFQYLLQTDSRRYCWGSFYMRMNINT